MIKIPPGAKYIDPNAATDTTEAEEDEETPAAGTTRDGSEIGTVPATGDPAADRCSPGTYTVEEGDYPIGVAEKFDVTIDALNTANASTAGYSSFYPGLEIVIPAATNC